MQSDLDRFEFTLGGRTLTGAWDRLRRYCGLDWSGGAPETWAYRYYDVVQTHPDALSPMDVISTAALHPGLSRGDLAYFHDHSSEIDDFLKTLPLDMPLRDADDATLARLDDLAERPGGPSLTLLSKVLHRKRPELIPLVDRHVLDWYRPVTGERAPAKAWPALLRALRADLGGQNALLLAMVSVRLENELSHRLSHLRLVDIALWMGSR